MICRFEHTQIDEKREKVRTESYKLETRSSAQFRCNTW